MSKCHIPDGLDGCSNHRGLDGCSNHCSSHRGYVRTYTVATYAYVTFHDVNGGTNNARTYIRTYVRTHVGSARERARTQERYVRTYVRACVRWNTYVRAYARAREGTHATRIRWSTYVRTDVASGATESCGSHGRERHYVRTYVLTSVRTYVRKGGRLSFLEPPLSSYRIGKSRDVRTYVRWVCIKWYSAIASNGLMYAYVIK